MVEMVRLRRYGEDCIDLLRMVWREMGYCSSKHLRSGLREWLPYFDNVSTEIKQLLLEMASSTMDISFAGIVDTNPDYPFLVDDIIHQTFIDVNENGFEAAAATATEFVSVGMAPDPKKKLNIVADRPFVFMLIDSRTDELVFIGRVINPNALDI